MKLSGNMGFDQIFSIAKQLSHSEKEKLIKALQKSLDAEKNKIKPERQLGKFEGQIWVADDFNEPLDDFQEYM